MLIECKYRYTITTLFNIPLQVPYHVSSPVSLQPRVLVLHLHLPAQMSILMKALRYRDKEEIDTRIVSEISEVGSIMSKSLPKKLQPKAM